MNTENFKNTDQRTIDLQLVFEQLCQLWYIVAAIIIICVSTALFYTKLICTPQYDSSAKIYIGKVNGTQISSSDISVSTSLTRDYTEIILDRTVLNSVIELLDLDMSYGALKQTITIDNPENTRIISITVRTSDPRKSMQIAQCICEVSQEKISDLFNIASVNIISDAYMPVTPSAPNLSRNLILGFFIGVAISILMLMSASFFNDKINSVRDIERYLEISVLAAIPYADSNSRRYADKSAQKHTISPKVRSHSEND